MQRPKAAVVGKRADSEADELDLDLLTLSCLERSSQQLDLAVGSFTEQRPGARNEGLEMVQRWDRGLGLGCGPPGRMYKDQKVKIRILGNTCTYKLLEEDRTARQVRGQPRRRLQKGDDSVGEASKIAAQQTGCLYSVVPLI